MVLDWVIHGDLSMRFNNEMNTQEGRGQAKEMWPARGGKGSSKKTANNTTDTASNRKPLRVALRAVVCSKRTNFVRTSLQRLVLQWEKLQAERRVERLLVELNSTVKKTGFKFFAKRPI